VFQVVVPKALASKELVKVYEGGEKVVLPPWDPMVIIIMIWVIWVIILPLSGHLLDSTNILNRSAGIDSER